MNKFTLFTKELYNTKPWLEAMAKREAKKTPTYEMQQHTLHAPEIVVQPIVKEPIFVRVSNEVADRLGEIKADLADLPLQPAVA